MAGRAEGEHNLNTHWRRRNARARQPSGVRGWPREHDIPFAA
jgi:hypothetical protein